MGRLAQEAGCGARCISRLHAQALSELQPQAWRKALRRHAALGARLAEEAFDPETRLSAGLPLSALAQAWSPQALKRALELGVRLESVNCQGGPLRMALRGLAQTDPGERQSAALDAAQCAALLSGEVSMGRRAAGLGKIFCLAQPQWAGDAELVRAGSALCRALAGAGLIPCKEESEELAQEALRCAAQSSPERSACEALEVYWGLCAQAGVDFSDLGGKLWRMAARLWNCGKPGAAQAQGFEGLRRAFAACGMAPQAGPGEAFSGPGPMQAAYEAGNEAFAAMLRQAFGLPYGFCPGQDGKTAVSYALDRGGSKAGLAFLAKTLECPQARSQLGLPMRLPGKLGLGAQAVHQAASKGSRAQLSLLLGAGADARALDARGAGVFHYLALCPPKQAGGAAECAEMLLAAGADPAARDAAGIGAMEALAIAGPPEALCALARLRPDAFWEEPGKSRILKALKARGGAICAAVEQAALESAGGAGAQGRSSDSRRL